MQILKRTLSALLAVVMIVALFPAVAFAETTTLEEFAEGQLLQTVDFSKYTFTNLVNTSNPLTSVFFYNPVEGDNNALSVKGDTQSVAGTASGFDLLDADGNKYTADSNSYYTMTYKVWTKSGASPSSTAAGDGIYVSVGGVLNNKTYLTFSTNVYHKNGAFRSNGTGWTARTNGSAALASDVSYNTEEIDGNDYHTIRVTYDGPNKKATAYILKAGQSGVHADDWTQWQQVSYTPSSANLKFVLTTHDRLLDCIIRDVNYYQGDIVCSGEKTEEITKEATCVEDGVKTYTCACGETTTEVIPATGEHNYVDGVCTVCQEDEPVLDPVASVNGVNYGSLEAAVAAVTEEENTIKLLKGSTVSSSIEISQDVIITADEAVTITMADDFSGDMVNITGGTLTLTGASEEAKITLAAGVKTVSIIAANGGDAVITNAILAGNTASTVTQNSANGFNANIEGGTFTLTNVDIRDVVRGNGIRAAETTQVVNLDNVTIDNVGRYGLFTNATVNIFNTQHADKALMISNTNDHCIDVKDGGKVISALENVPEGTYPIQLNTTKISSATGIIVRKGELNVTNISISNTASYGIWLQQAAAVATVKNAVISSKAAAFETVANSALTVSNVAVNNCSESTANIQGTLNGTISFPDHKYVAGETVAPTCLVDGYTPYTCSVCGASENRDIVEAPGQHSYDDGVVTTAPTCINDGVLTLTCTREGCGHSRTEAIDPTGKHTYDEFGNCTTEGCDASQCQHTYAEEVTTQPTCTEKGVKTFTCTVEGCGYSYTEEIAPLGHSYNDECDTECNVCGEEREAPTAVATIGNVNYGSLESAVAAANDAEGQQTITLLSDVTVTSTITVSNDVVLVSNGAYTVSGAARMFSVAEGGSLTVTGTESAKIAFKNTATIADNEVFFNKGTLKLSYVTTSGGYRGIHIAKNGTVEVNNVTIENTANHGVYMADSTTLTGSNLTLEDIGNIGILSENSTVTIDGLQITGTKKQAIEVKKGVVTITDFAISETGSAALRPYSDNGVKFILTDGTVTTGTYGLAMDSSKQEVALTNVTFVRTGTSTDPVISVASGTLKAENVTVNMCGTVAASIKGTLEGAITYTHTYVNGVCSVCSDVLASITLSSATLNLQDKVSTIYNATAVLNTAVDHCGVLLYDSEEKAAEKNPADAYETIVLDESYAAQSEGIDARDMDKSQFAVAYVKLTDGSYIFGTKDGEDQIVEYSPLIYCETMKNDATVGALCYAMMQYGAAAQKAQYGMTSGLMNEGFEAPEGVAYSESMLGETVFSANTRTINGMKLRSVTMALKGAISYIVKFTAEGVPAGKTLYAEYTLANGQEGYVELADGGDGKLWATISGIAPKDLGATLTVKPYYLDANDEKVYGGELVFSGYEYTRIVTKNATYGEDVKELAKALAMYVYYANVYGNQ